MTAERVGLGVRVHSGWAALAVTSGTLGVPLIVERRRIALVPSDDDAFVQPYHAAAKMTLPAARVTVERALAHAERLAVAGLRTLASDVEPAALVSCAILDSKAKLPEDLSSTLQSHALIHAAEGNLFRTAIERAARSCGLRAIRLVEKELEGLLGTLRVAPGPPWTRDEKLASLAAFLALDQYQRDLSATVAS